MGHERLFTDETGEPLYWHDLVQIRMKSGELVLARVMNYEVLGKAITLCPGHGPYPYIQPCITFKGTPETRLPCVRLYQRAEVEHA